MNTGPRIPGAAAPAGGPFELWQARSYYSEAIADILRGGVRDDPRLPDLQRSLIRTYYLEVAASDLWPERQVGLFQLGRDGYGRLAWYVVQTSGSGVDLAKALVDLADWELLFARNGEPVERYDEAYRLLLSEHVPEATIRAIFPAGPPIMLPTFEPSPLVTEPPREGAAYLDVSFELSKYGVARRIRVDEASGAEAEAAADRVVGLIARARVRPQPTPNQPKEAPVRRVRYYVGR